MYKLLLLALVPAALCRIEVRIKAAKSQSGSAVDVLGSSVEPVSGTERNTFKLGDAQVKSAIYRCHGGTPDSVYLNSPTPWGDVFTKYGWSPVSRTLVPVSARIVRITSEPSVVARKTFINKSSLKATYNAGIEESVQQSTANSWSKSGELTVGQEIEYSVDLGALEVGGSTSISYSSGWGTERSKSLSITIGTTSGVEVELLPGQSVISELTANRGNMEIEVEYAASLDGNVFANYDSQFKGHFFWRYDANALLDSENAPRSIRSKETIKIGFYSDATIVVKDKLSTNHIHTQNVPIRPGGGPLLKSLASSRVIVPVPDLDPKALVNEAPKKSS